MSNSPGTAGSDRPVNPFTDPKAVAGYTDGPPRFVPGYTAMQRMTMLLLAERVPDDGRVLVLGAGGGLEIRVFAESHPGWSFEGIDPSAEMLDLARQTLGPAASRARLVQGYIEDGSAGPFHGATCLLTMHFLDAETRLRTAREVHRRLAPGAPFVVSHLSFPHATDSERDGWLARHAAFLEDAGIEPEKAAKARQAIRSETCILSPEEDEAVLREAGFSDVELFYAGFSFRGWVARA